MYLNRIKEGARELIEKRMTRVEFTDKGKQSYLLLMGHKGKIDGIKSDVFILHLHPADKNNYLYNSIISTRMVAYVPYLALLTKNINLRVFFRGSTGAKEVKYDKSEIIKIYLRELWTQILNKIGIR